jgi:hypothetical protein
MKKQLSVLQLPKFQPKQQFAFDALANEKLLGGATRGGKTFFNKLMLIRLCSAVSNLRADIFRLHLDDVYQSYMEGEGSFPELLALWERDGLVKITRETVDFLWNNSGFTLKHLGNDQAKSKGQGTPVQIRIYDEATQLLESRFRFLRGWVGMTETHREKAAHELEKVFPNFTYEQRYNYFPQIIYSTNPMGLSAGYFRKNFVKAAERFEIFQAPIDDGGFKRIYVPFRIEDNEFENEESVRARISGLGDAGMVDALLNENWDAPIGDFYNNYKEEKLCVKDFEIPEHGYKFRTFDWGSGEPFACLWAATASEDMLVKNIHDATISIPQGSIIFFREWYGCDPKDWAKGLQYKNEDIAKGIVRRSGDCPTWIKTLTDSFPFNELGGPSIASVFEDNGVVLNRADTSRVLGWKLLRDRMEGNSRGEPTVYVFESCEYLRYYWPMLQRHKTKPEDAVEDGEPTHIMDCARYAVATYPKIVHKIEKPKPITIGTERPTFNDVIERHSRMKNAGKDW